MIGVVVPRAWRADTLRGVVGGEGDVPGEGRDDLKRSLVSRPNISEYVQVEVGMNNFKNNLFV